MKRHFTISEEDWKELMKLSREARNTPVMALSVGEGLAGRDFASMARQRVLNFWAKLGEKYGFDGSTVEPMDEAGRVIAAVPTTSKT